MLYKINAAPHKDGSYRQRDINNNLSTQHSALSTQHSALSTQHSALSTQHSALILSFVAVGSNMPPTVQSSFYIVSSVLDSDFLNITPPILYKHKNLKKLLPPTLFVGVGMLHCTCTIQRIRRHRNERKRR